MVQIAAVHLAKSKVVDRPVIRNITALFEYLMILLSREPVEHFRVLYLDIKNRLICDEKISQGTMNAVRPDLRAIVQRVLTLHATGVILVHNHPSGDPEPSREDIALTSHISVTLRALSVEVYDHVIVGNGRCVSLRNEKLM